LDYIDEKNKPLESGYFLENVVKPLYSFLKNNSYKECNNVLRERTKDHSSTISYDDINESFWNSETIKMLLISLPSINKESRYLDLKNADWNNFFKKTFSEYRTFWHLLVSFRPIFIFHVSLFFYMLFWGFFKDETTDIIMKNIFLSYGAFVSLTMLLFSCFLEYLITRYLDKTCLAFIIVTAAINIATNSYVVLFCKDEHIRFWISHILVGISIFTSILCVILPRNLTPSPKEFTRNFAPLSLTSYRISIILW
jgi:1,3-beta-glucan synthase